MKTNLKWRILWLIKCSFFVLIFNTESVGQKTADSLGNQLKKLLQMSPTNERDSLILYTAYVIISGSKKPESTLYLDSLRRFAESSKWEKSMGAYYYIKANKHLDDKELYAAFNAFEKSLVEFRALKDEAKMLFVDNRFISLLNWNMIENVLEPQVQKKYISYLKETIALAKAKKDTAVWGNVEITLGAFYVFVQKDFKNCILHSNNVLKLVEKKDRNEWFDFYHIALLGKSLGILNLDEPKGLKMIEDLRIICEKNIQNPQAKYVICQLGTFTGRYFLEKKDYKTALQYANIANKHRFWGNFPYFDNVLNKLLYECYKGLNNQSQAFKYLELVKKYEDEADHKRMNENYAEWQLKYEDEKQKSQIQSLENQKLTQTRNILSIAGLLALCIIGYVFWNNQKLKKKNAEIEQALFKGQTLERKRVAEELHDTLSAKISGIRWRLEAIEPDFKIEKHQQIYQSSVNALAEVYTDVRLIAHNLLPAELETKGLFFALQHLIKELNGLDKTKFSLQIPDDLGRFKNKIEYEIFSIILELSNNILKHSQAQNATISLEKVNQKLTLTVADNGVGFGENKDKKGMGMDNLKSRVLTLNGTLKIENQEGVKVEIEVPV